MAKTQRSTGTVKWFSAQKGFGFIAPDEGGEDLFVHQTAIRSEGFRTLSEGQPVVFAVDFGDNGRSKAIEVEAASRSHRRGIRSGRDGGVFGGRGRGGAYGRDGRGGRSGGHGSCFNCGRMGHLARDCYSGSAGGGGGGGGRGYGGGRGGGRRGGSRGCYNCGEEGHFARDCPHREQKREMMKEK